MGKTGFISARGGLELRRRRTGKSLSRYKKRGTHKKYFCQFEYFDYAQYKLKSKTISC